MNATAGTLNSRNFLRVAAIVSKCRMESVGSTTGVLDARPMSTSEMRLFSFARFDILLDALRRADARDENCVTLRSCKRSGHCHNSRMQQNRSGFIFTLFCKNNSQPLYYHQPLRGLPMGLMRLRIISDRLWLLNMEH